MICCGRESKSSNCTVVKQSGCDAVAAFCHQTAGKYRARGIFIQYGATANDVYLKIATITKLNGQRDTSPAQWSQVITGDDTLIIGMVSILEEGEVKSTTSTMDRRLCTTEHLTARVQLASRRQ
jgi:hypothetical protein